VPRSNDAVIAGRDATLIVEGHFFPEGAELEIEVARMVSKAPVRGAVNTTTTSTIPSETSPISGRSSPSWRTNGRQL
jgi:hypothetical protein